MFTAVVAFLVQWFSPLNWDAPKMVESFLAFGYKNLSSYSRNEEQEEVRLQVLLLEIPHSHSLNNLNY